MLCPFGVSLVCRTTLAVSFWCVPGLQDYPCCVLLVCPWFAGLPLPYPYGVSLVSTDLPAACGVQDYLEQHKDEVLVAERAVLYTLGFDLNAQHPYSFLVNRLAALGLLQVCACVCVCVHICVCMCALVCARTYGHVCLFTLVCLCLYTGACVCVCERERGGGGGRVCAHVIMWKRVLCRHTLELLSPSHH